MCVLVTETAGMLGHALMPVLEKDHPAVGLSTSQVFLCDLRAESQTWGYLNSLFSCWNRIRPPDLRYQPFLRS